ncbi:MAG TPA: prolyl oligopeptidase family serine peptidase [Chryseosolibacter sp.]
MRFQIFLTLVLAGSVLSFRSGAQQTAKITPSNVAYLEYLPDGYRNNSNLYPVVISLHGIKERGTTSTDPAMLLSSVLTVANVGLPKYVKNGAKYPFILISPQLKTSYGSWPAAYVLDVINYVKKTLRVDPRRIYITGLSLGGYGVWTTIGAYPEVFAAAVPICSGGNALSKACAIAAENVAVWAFHGDADAVVSYTVTTKMVNAINACTPKPNPLAKATLFAGLGHSIWDKVYNQTNALDWMLSYVNGTAPSSSNLPPLVDAGIDIVEYLPANTAVCNGSASDPDGTVTAYVWSQVSGPSAATLENKTTKSLKASNLLAGTYTFRLKATDDKGAYANDDVKVIISSSSAPSVSAGADKTITLPTNYVDIQGTASDPDGIASYQWTKVSGGTAGLSGQTTPKLRAYNLLEGTYLFRLTVKDNKGYSKYDDVKVTVLSATTNMAPVANAGPDKSLLLPASSVKLYGSAKDGDGTIASYKWTQYSGPTQATISYSTSPAASISGLKEGKYYFRLTVKDNDGASDYDNVLVKVSSGTVTVIDLDTSFETLVAMAN